MNSKAPLVPFIPGDLLGRGVEEIRRDAETKSAISGGQFTDLVTLTTVGASQNIEHKFGRAPSGFFVAFWSGSYPTFSVDLVTSKRFTITSISGAGAKFRLWVF